jgi:DNA-binding transcriptional LysR family regulator
MDFDDLQAFKTLSRELHFGRTASQLHITQSHLSRTIRRLESEFAATFFDRTTRRVGLTPAGIEFGNLADRLLATIEDGRRNIAGALSGERGQIRISAAGQSFFGVVSELARAVSDRHPHMDREIRLALRRQDVIDDLVAGKTDIAFARFRSIPPDIRTHAIWEQHYSLALPYSFALPDSPATPVSGGGRPQAVPPVEQLRSMPFIALPPSSGSIVLEDFIAWCHHMGFSPKIVQTAPDTASALALAAAGIGATFTIEEAVSSDLARGVHMISLEDSARPAMAYVAWSPTNDNPVLEPVLEIARAVLPSVRDM